VNNQQKRLAETLRRVLPFLDRDAPRAPQFVAARRRVADVKERAERLIVEQFVIAELTDRDGLSLGEMQRDLREDLMFPVSRWGKKLLRNVPGAERALALPPKRATALKVAAAAERMAKGVKPSAKLFVEAGLPKDFVARLRADARSLRERANRSGEGIRRRKAVGAALATALRDGRIEIGIVDALLLPYVRKNSTLGVLWRAAKRVGPRLGRPLKKKNERRE
jgi:hypothetical protein